MRGELGGGEPCSEGERGRESVAWWLRLVFRFAVVGEKGGRGRRGQRVKEGGGED